jgi:hypothetical protein
LKKLINDKKAKDEEIKEIKRKRKELLFGMR